VACRFRQQRRTIRRRAAWRISPRRLACRVRVNSVGGSNSRSKQLHSADSETKNVRSEAIVSESPIGTCSAIRPRPIFGYLRSESSERLQTDTVLWRRPLTSIAFCVYLSSVTHAPPITCQSVRTSNSPTTYFS
jgi:hypothetical protein